MARPHLTYLAATDQPELSRRTPLTNYHHNPEHTDGADAGLDALLDSPAFTRDLRRAFGLTATPGGASSTPSPTRGRTRGVSAPRVAERVRRGGAPGQGFGAEGGPEPDELHTAQSAILTDHHRHETATTADSEAGAAVPRNRRFEGVKREERVGPLRFKPDEHGRLQAAALAHGYNGVSGFAADVVLAFVEGRFFIDLPLAEERRATHHFRSVFLRRHDRLGNNVNQIARADNGGYQRPDHSTRTIDRLLRLQTEIAQALRPPADQETQPRP
ncbi:MobC family plasmid mobilization relaxosome protein [Kitasatospora sp. NPDC048365]|uniref:MobC family plasmid mobilization relaxosome protein n=1 Tax=Kitasatospora sp. NPDC048365 TaxID=3364050 RepID=UPI003723C579